MVSFFRNLILWRYGRSTWQYDVLCVLVLAFVFLTPKSWFENGEPRSGAVHRNPVSTVVVVTRPSDSSSDMTETEVKRYVQSLPGRADARIREVRAARDDSGRVTEYQVDIE